MYKVGPQDFEEGGIYQLRVLQGVSDVNDSESVPQVSALTGEQPNPFNPRTIIAYDLAVAGAVALDIYDLKGARVRRLVAENRSAGRHTVVWDGLDESGQRVASGVYLARLQAEARQDYRKLVMLK